MEFQLKALRFAFEAREEIHFPPGKSSNILRGAFGIIFRQLACVPGCQFASTCDVRSTCPYARMFEPTGPAPSGLADWPRPFVFRASHLDGMTISRGKEFHFDVNLFDLKNPADQYLKLAFAQLAQDGLGPSRSKVELITAGSTDRKLSLDAQTDSRTRLCINFVTPTELKSGSSLAEQPDFPILVARVRDRISALSELYGSGAPELDYKAFGERASQVKMIGCDIEHVKVQRRSTRTGQSHSIGGFVGKAEYQGPLGEFLPWLSVAQWTGVGRQTVWGKGVIQIASAS